jgi:hypothetical protein
LTYQGITKGRPQGCPFFFGCARVRSARPSVRRQTIRRPFVGGLPPTGAMTQALFADLTEID